MASFMTRYVRWLGTYATHVLVALAIAVGCAVALCIFHLPLRADLTDLLPDDAPAVRDQQRIEAHRVPNDTTYAVISAPDPAQRAAVTHELVAAIDRLDHSLVDHVEADDRETRAFIGDRRALFVPLAELTDIHDAVATWIAHAKLRANPLFVDLDPQDGDAADRRVRELADRAKATDARLARSGYSSEDGLTGLVVVRSAFPAAEIPDARRLTAELERIRAGIAAAHPDVTIGYAGGAVAAVAEHDAMLEGMAWSSAVTAVLVMVVLVIHLRSRTLVALVAITIGAGTVIAFGIGALTIGHLNVASAFLGAVIAGNGVNYGILVAARYAEARATRPTEAALAIALSTTGRPTLVAALGAAIAYGSLATTSFRGFAEFAVIGGVGMIACWIVTMLALPAMLVRAERIAGATSPSIFGRAVVRTLGGRGRWLVVAVGAATVVAGIASVRFLANDPYQYDIDALTSDAPSALRTRHWLHVIEQKIGAGSTSRALFGVAPPARVDEVVAAIDRAHRAHPDMIGGVASVRDALPADQPKKLALLADLRAQLPPDVVDTLEPADQDLVHALLPDRELHPIGEADLPHELVARLADREGTIGDIVIVRPGVAVDPWNGRALIRFAAMLRDLHLGDPVALSGPPIVFADILVSIQRDGPRACAVALGALVVMVVLVVGRGRRAVAVIVATIAGSAGMIALSALAGLHVDFLNFTALPLTLGLGVDYAINIADRAADDDPDVALRTTGGTVLVCSLTTVIGYASLLLSHNQAIRGFGLASLLGEVTCVIAALVLVPAIVRSVRSPSRARGRSTAPTPSIRASAPRLAP